MGIERLKRSHDWPADVARLYSCVQPSTLILSLYDQGGLQGLPREACLTGTGVAGLIL